MQEQKHTLKVQFPNAKGSSISTSNKINKKHMQHSSTHCILVNDKMRIAAKSIILKFSRHICRHTKESKYPESKAISHHIMC